MSRQPSAISFQPVGRGGPTLRCGTDLRSVSDGRYGARPLRAFTLIELLIVITVIGILIAVIGLVGVKVVHQQKVTLTETTMRNVKLAIDQFKDNNPLANIYDRKGFETFGPYPPYQLANFGVGVAYFVEPRHPLVPSAGPGVPLWLSERVARDLSGVTGNLTYEYWAQFAPADANDDNRALYTYLKVFAPDALAQVPSSAMKPLTTTPEYVNPTGSGPAPGLPNSPWVDVLGIYDAWGVPLDYFLYVKLEYTLLPSGSPGWRVAERIPVLRSHGISRDEYDAGVVEDPQVWIFSDPFPSPAALAVDKTSGNLILPFNSQRAGWARVQAAGDTYGYVP